MIGKSAITDDKQEYYKRFLSYHIAISLAVISKNSWWCNSQYHYFDLNAGDGIGSVKIFFDITQKYKNRNFIAHLYEIDDETREKLSLFVQDHQVENIIWNIHSDNRMALHETALIQKGYGLVYTDPNGIFNHSLLTEISKESKYLDILINVNSVALKRTLGLKNNPKYENSISEVCLCDKIEEIRKQFWIIREILGVWQWTFLFGSNWQAVDKFASYGFYNLYSETGKKIWDVVSQTKKKYFAKESKAVMNVIDCFFGKDFGCGIKREKKGM